MTEDEWLAVMDRAWRAGMAPEPQLRVNEWADRFRMLPSTSAEPGRWRTARTPYLREIMDCLGTGSPWERAVFQKGAQIGGTEAGLNWIAYIIANAPGLAMMVMPSLDMVRRNTRTRIDPMIEATPELRSRVAPPRAKDALNTAFSKGFPGGSLVMAGANSAAGLRSTPARYLMLDEVDGFPADADGEGDPVDLAVRRTATYRGKSPQPETPYQRAAQVWDDRIGSARVQARNWRLMAFGSLALSAGLSGALFWQSMNGSIVPWVVQVDRLGQAQAFAPATADYQPNDAQIAFYLARFIEQVRGIPADAIIVRQNWLRAYDFTTQAGALALNDYARANDPFAKVGRQQVAVEVSSIIRASTRALFWTSCVTRHARRRNPMIGRQPSIS